jgi:hypothetical protein
LDEGSAYLTENIRINGDDVTESSKSLRPEGNRRRAEGFEDGSEDRIEGSTDGSRTVDVFSEDIHRSGFVGVSSTREAWANISRLKGIVGKRKGEAKTHPPEKTSLF